VSFAASFSIVSPGGPYTDANGAAQVAPANTPRFDHTAQGVALGLLVQGLPEASAADVVTIDAGVVANQACTILHVLKQPSGSVVAKAIWSRNPTQTINALLNAKGWHQSIVVVGRALRVTDGAVTFRGQTYGVGQYLAVDLAGADGLGANVPAETLIVGA
jgi:hypothetical protein